MYKYYAEIEEAENQIALYVYGTENIDYFQAKKLQKFFDVKEILALYEKHNDWILAISEYVVKHDIQISKDDIFISHVQYD